VAATPPPPPPCTSCGKVVSVTQETRKGKAGAGGAIAGAVIGGVLGHQVGGGTGKTIATVAGAAGGAYAGKKIEEKAKSEDFYRVTVRMDNGSEQSFEFDGIPPWREGDKVKVEGGGLVKP
jgi:uncharacterized protein YcfJ